MGKLAAKFDCGSVLSRRSKDFKSLSPVNIEEFKFEAAKSKNLGLPQANNTLDYMVMGEKKMIEAKT